MCQRIVFCFFILIGLTVNVQTVDAGISGKVSNQAGKPIAKAILTLVKQGIKDTTDSNGMYSLTPIPDAVVPLLVPQTEKISLNMGVLELSLTDPSPVKVEIFDVKGNLMKRELLQNAQAGIYRLDITENSCAANLLVIHASIGRRVMTFRYLPLNNGKYTVNSSVESFMPVSGKLAKITAVSDTVKVTAANYKAKATAVASYDTTVNITLDTAGNEGAVTVQLDQTRQKIDGFGINNNWKPLGSSGISACFDSTTGLGLSILRIGMFSDGNLFSNNNWNDVKDAKAKGCKYIIGSTWSPPGDWKSGQNGGAGSENGGGHLNKDKYTAWADRIAAFPGKVKQNAGVDLYAMSVGNEPDFASCGTNEPCNGNYPTTLFTAEEMVAFVKVAGPKLKAAGCKVMAPEASEWLHTWSDSSACCSVPGNKPSSNPLKGKGYDYGHALFRDKEAWAVLDIMGVHQYDDQVATPWPSDVPEKKPVWQTEMSGVKWWPDGQPSTTIENGIVVAGWIHNALTVGEANGWLYWWYNGGSDTNEGLLLNGTDTKRHYTFGNYTKYVRPGMTRVDIAGAVPKDVLLTAFTGDGGKVVIVAINKGSAAASVPITIAGGTAPASFTPIVTDKNENWASKTAVTVSNGSFTADLAGVTVTTFVSK